MNEKKLSKQLIFALAISIVSPLIGIIVLVWTALSYPIFHEKKKKNE